VATTLAEAGALALLALIPSSLPAAIASAVLFGAAYNATVGIQAIWSTHVFSQRPSLGLSATLSANGLGLMLGPLGAGLLTGALGLETVLLLGAGLVAAAGLAAPREAIMPVAPATSRA
jgi:predicted MFS family arabinose efflux permease